MKKKTKKKIKKIYKSIIEYVKEEYKFLIVCALIFFIFLFRLPYNIYTGGGIIDIHKRVEVENGYSSKGSFNMAYVDEIRATIPTYLLSYIFKWDVAPIEDELIDENDTLEDSWKRNRLYLEDSNDSALISAFKLANERIDIKKKYVVALYILPEAQTNLEVGDIILSVNGKAINSQDELRSIISSYSVSEKINMRVLRDDKEIDCYANLILLDNQSKIGISMYNKYQYEIDKKVNFKFKSNEAGPSAGLMLALEIYNQLTEDDLTNGKMIAGTGTIDANGRVGSIGGVKYKIKGADSDGAKIFFVPTDNYLEALKAKKDNDLEIELVQVDTLEDAVNYLKGVNNND